MLDALKLVFYGAAIWSLIQLINALQAAAVYDHTLRAVI